MILYALFPSIFAEGLCCPLRLGFVLPAIRMLFHKCLYSHSIFDCPHSQLFSTKDVLNVSCSSDIPVVRKAFRKDYYHFLVTAFVFFFCCILHNLNVDFQFNPLFCFVQNLTTWLCLQHTSLPFNRYTTNKIAFCTLMDAVPGKNMHSILLRPNMQHLDRCCCSLSSVI